MPEIYISYRWSDEPEIAGRLYDRMSAHLGKETVFIDTQDIRAGQDYVQKINEEVLRSRILLVVIGKGWLDARDGAGNRKIDRPQDSLRHEISTALSRDILVVPVMVNDATVPKPEDLPQTLRSLVRRQAYKLTEEHFDQDVVALVRTLERVVKRGSRTGPVLNAVPRSGLEKLGVGIGSGPKGGVQWPFYQ